MKQKRKICIFRENQKKRRINAAARKISEKIR